MKYISKKSCSIWTVCPCFTSSLYEKKSMGVNYVSFSWNQDFSWGWGPNQNCFEQQQDQSRINKLFIIQVYVRRRWLAVWLRICKSKISVWQTRIHTDSILAGM